MAEVTVSTKTTLERVVITFSPDSLVQGASVCFRTISTGVGGDIVFPENVSDPVAIDGVKDEDAKVQLKEVMGEATTNALILLAQRDAEIEALKARLQALHEASMQSLPAAG